MKLWKLRPIDDLPDSDNPWFPCHEKAFGFVVRAQDEYVARFLASGMAGEEGAAPWIEPKYSTCAELSVDGEPCVLLRDHVDA